MRTISKQEQQEICSAARQAHQSARSIPLGLAQGASHGHTEHRGHQLNHTSDVQEGAQYEDTIIEFEDLHEKECTAAATISHRD